MQKTESNYRIVQVPNWNINFPQITLNNKFNLMKTRSRPSHQNQRTSFSKSISLENEGESAPSGLPNKKLKTPEENKPLIKITGYEAIPTIPAIKLTHQDMKGDPLTFLTRLQLKYKAFGAVKLICPPEWNPPLQFKFSKANITTRIQPIHNLKYGKGFQEKKQAYTLTTFHDLAVQFQRRYKLKFPYETQNPLLRLQSQYWNLVKGPNKQQQEQNPKKYKVTVEYAADLPANKYGSGFPTVSSSKSQDQYFNYAESSFNLNNFYHSPRSLLRISDTKGQFIGGITTPWIYVGMMFSTFCWHIEDSGINSINYNHYGGKKIWYIVPESDKKKFNDFVDEKIGNRDAINKITYMIDPLELVAKGIKVYKAYQQPREYICTLFNAYHCGFSESYNIGEAVNYVTHQSLPLIKSSLINSNKPSLFCYQWLIYQNYLQTKIEKRLIQGFNELQTQYKNILKEQQSKLRQISKNLNLKQITFLNDKIKYDRYVCADCKRYLFLSFCKCENCQKTYCLQHSEQCCEDKGFFIVSRIPNEDRKKYIQKICH